MDYMTMRKGLILNKKKVSIFDFRYVVVDYDQSNIYCINLNETGFTKRDVVKFKYKDFENGLYIE